VIDFFKLKNFLRIDESKSLNIENGDYGDNSQEMEIDYDDDKTVSENDGDDDDNDNNNNNNDDDDGDYDDDEIEQSNIELQKVIDMLPNLIKDYYDDV
jgi:hypothetical protein